MFISMCRRAVEVVRSKRRRLPVVGLATALSWTAPFHAGSALAQGGSLVEKIKLCSTCHGEDGNSKMDKSPSLAGQPAFFLRNQLRLMREGVRKVDAMAAIVKDLKDSDIDALARHYAVLTPKRSDEKLDRAASQRGGEVLAQRRCTTCHLRTLGGQQQVPRIAKQRIDYLIVALKSYRDGQRPGADTAMNAPVAGASDADIEGLAHYLWSH
jgi:cytochrome c553